MNYDNLTLLTDLYELTMMQGYFKTGSTERVIFDSFLQEESLQRRLCHLLWSGAGDRLYQESAFFG